MFTIPTHREIREIWEDRRGGGMTFDWSACASRASRTPSLVSLISLLTLVRLISLTNSSEHKGRSREQSASTH